jgi:cob(I)alamin adenosyltransferase
MKYLNRLSDVLFVLAKIEVFEIFVGKVADMVEKITGANTGDGWFEDRCAALYRAAAAESEKIGISISFAVADLSGTLIYFHRQPGAILASVGIAQNKAYTSAAMRMPTGELAKHADPGGTLFGINTVDPKLVIFGGGFPLIKDGSLVGAFGVSGGSVKEDEQIGRAVLAEFETM